MVRARQDAIICNTHPSAMALAASGGEAHRHFRRGTDPAACRRRTLTGRLLGLALILAAADPIDLIEAHNPEGGTVYINPEQITTLREPAGADRRHFPASMHCVVVMASGKFVPVRESCKEIYELLIHPDLGTAPPGPPPGRLPQQ